jgi:hypothetical protein
VRRVVLWIVLAWIAFMVVNGASRYVYNQGLRNQAATCVAQGQVLGAGGCQGSFYTVTP